MTAIEDRPTLPERYSRALESTHLEALSNERCSVDMLIAAGWVKEGLGTALYRLRSEYDAVRGQQVQSRRALLELQHDINRTRRALRLASTSEDRARFSALVQRGVDELKRAELTERVLILSHLKSLIDTRQALGRFASIQATRQRYMQPDTEVAIVAGQCLSLWLDPLCPHCNGTGLDGDLGVVRGICGECHGSKLRSYRLHRSESGHQFGRGLLVLMDKKTDYVTGQMRRFLRNN